MTEENTVSVGGVRKLLEDMIAPNLGRLEERVRLLTKACSDLAEGVEKNREEIKDIWKYIGHQIGGLKQVVGHLEGRIESAKEEIAAKVKLALVEQLPTGKLLPRVEEED